jgi:hypothetical protein
VPVGLFFPPGLFAGSSQAEEKTNVKSKAERITVDFNRMRCSFNDLFETGKQDTILSSTWETYLSSPEKTGRQNLSLDIFIIFQPLATHTHYIMKTRIILLLGIAIAFTSCEFQEKKIVKDLSDG